MVETKAAASMIELLATQHVQHRLYLSLVEQAIKEASELPGDMRSWWPSGSRPYHFGWKHLNSEEYNSP